MPDREWNTPRQHSDTDDGRLLARIDERTINIAAKLDSVQATNRELFGTVDEDIKALEARVDTLEKNWVKVVAYLTVGGVVVTILAPIAQTMLRLALHLPP